MGLWKNIKIFVRTKFAKSEYLLHGIRIPIDRTVIGDRVLYSIIRGRYEFPESQALIALVKADDRVLELGGGVGLISALASKIAKLGQVVSVEANPTMVKYISRVHALNNVQGSVINAVVAKSDEIKTVKFYLRRNFWSSSMSPEPPDYVECIDVPAASIDDLVQQHRPSVVIIDIEGGELDLIHGSWAANIRLIIMEVHPEVIGEAGVQKIIDFFVRSGIDVKVDGKMLLMTR
jgi:FkbM family methyltransferase